MDLLKSEGFINVTRGGQHVTSGRSLIPIIGCEVGVQGGILPIQPVAWKGKRRTQWQWTRQQAPPDWPGHNQIQNMSGFISVLVNNYVPSNIYTVTCLLALCQVIVLIFCRGVEAHTYKHTLPLMHRNCTQTHQHTWMHTHAHTHTHTDWFWHKTMPFSLCMTATIKLPWK